MRELCGATCENRPADDAYIRAHVQNWGGFARLAYPAATMKCAESWAFTLMTLAASLQSDTATAAIGVAYNVYGVLFIVFCVSA